MLPSTDTYEFLMVNNIDSSPDFTATVCGSSMEPLLSEGDILLIKKQDSVEHGELGVFMLDGVRHIKRMYFKDGILRLCSLDMNCGDVAIDQIHNITCQGKAIKVMHPGESKFTEIQLEPIE